MRYLGLTLLSTSTCVMAIALSGCGSMGGSGSQFSPAPAVADLGSQVNGVAPNRWQYIQFNEAMDPATINSRTIVVAGSSGRTVAGSVVYDANFDIAGFLPNPALQDNANYTLTVTTGVASAQGVHLPAAYTHSFTTRASTDESPIYVKNVTPFPDASCVSATTPIAITFSEGADVSTLNSTDIMITGPGNTVIQAKMGYNAATATVTVTPTAPLPPGSITVSVNNVADAAGVKMTSPFGWSFLTTCGGSGGGGGTTTQYIAPLLAASPGTVNGQVTIDTTGNTTIQMSGATPKTTYTVQFCPASSPAATSKAPACLDIRTISTDAGGNATSTAKFPKSGDWGGDFYVNNSAGKTVYQTYLTPTSSNQTYLATLQPESTTNGGALVSSSSPQDPLRSGTVSFSNGSLQFTLKGGLPSTKYLGSESETVFLDGSGTYVVSTFTTDAQGNANSSTTLTYTTGDIFEVGPQSGDGYIGGFSVP